MNETLQDLQDDLEVLGALIASAKERLSVHTEKLKEEEKHYRPATHSYLAESAHELSARYESVRTAIASEVSGSWSEQDTSRLIAFKKEQADMVRTLQGILGSVLSAGNWQSPSFAHTMLSRAGAEEGSIKESNNDYHRDLHAAEAAYARDFAAAYIDRGSFLPAHAYPTSSGMSAVATALNAFAHTVGGGMVLAGASSYFQNKWALDSMFPGKVIYADEFDTEELIALAKKHRPRIVFLDSLCGAEELPMPDLARLIPALESVLGRHATLIIDNTCLGPMFQPLLHKSVNPFGMGLVVVESLLKYHQFGFDKTNAGIAWAPAGSQEGLSFARMRLGATIPDASVLTLPAPDRARLEKRMLRIGRNANMLAERLSAHIGEGRGMLAGVVHPGLPEYPGYAWTKDMAFRGGFVTLRFKTLHRTTLSYDIFVRTLMNAARVRGVDLVGSTSFGFDTTRIYVAARYSSKAAKPFVRVSLGTESAQEMEALCAAFEDAIG